MKTTVNNVKSPYINIHSFTDNVSYCTKAMLYLLAIPLNPITNFFTQGLSDFLALETLRHGTSITSYINIRIKGADPKYGGIKGSAQLQAHSKRLAKNKFYVSKDSEANHSQLGYNTSQFIVRCLNSRSFCTTSGFCMVSGKKLPSTILKVLSAILHFFFVPTIKFRFQQPEIQRIFVNDPEFSTFTNPSKAIAYYTTHKISTKHIGLKGVLTEGVKGNICKRMRAHPVKVTWGLIKLINPIGALILAAYGLHIAIYKATHHQ